MSWKERRTITILSTILGLLVAILLIVLGIRYRENRAEQDAFANPDAGGATLEEQVYFSALTYYNGSTTLSFSLDGQGRWIWSDDPSFPLDETTVLSILSVLLNWTPQQILTDAESIQAAELSRPTATLTATTSEGTVVTLLFGKATEDGSAHYVRVNNDVSSVHVVADAVYDLLCIPIYDMMVLPELPELTEACIDSISISGSAPEDGSQPAPEDILFTARRVDGDQTAVSWRHSGANVTDEPLLRALLDDLKMLSLVKCKIYRPSAEAVSICGFDAPAATARIAYTQNGASQTLQLTVGTPLPDGSGYYVRLDDSSTIYQVAPAPLEALLTLAANGLAGDAAPEP